MKSAPLARLVSIRPAKVLQPARAYRRAPRFHHGARTKPEVCRDRVYTWAPKHPRPWSRPAKGRTRVYRRRSAARTKLGGWQVRPRDPSPAPSCSNSARRRLQRRWQPRGRALASVKYYVNSASTGELQQLLQVPNGSSDEREAVVAERGSALFERRVADQVERPTGCEGS